MNVTLRGFALGLAAILVPALAWAGKPVYKHVNESGQVLYSDQPASPSGRPIRNRVAPEPSASQYNESVVRTESERIALRRAEIESRQPRNVVVYDPSRQRARASPQTADRGMPQRLRPRWDPNLPDMPPPSAERRYYYDGR